MEPLRGSGVKLSIQTKSDLVLRDIDLIKSFPDARVGFSINTPDEAFRDDMDKAVSIERRLTAMKHLHDAGIRTICFISPIYPDLTNVPAIIDRVKDNAIRILEYVRDDDRMKKPFDAPPVIVNFYHEQIKNSAKKRLVPYLSRRKLTHRKTDHSVIPRFVA